MTTPTIPAAEPLSASRLTNTASPGIPTGARDGASAVSWPAIFAGAVGAAALSLILLVLGTGLGLSVISPWAGRGLGTTAIGVGTIAWILLVAILASGMGGFLAGRLRSRWVEAHTDEVYFRDTAHGFLAWAVATLLTAGLLASAVGGIVGAGVQAGTAALGAAGSATAGAMGAVAEKAKGATDNSGLEYFTDSLFRPMPSGSAASGVTGGAAAPNEATTARSSDEVGRIFVRNLSANALAGEDARYVGQLIAQRTGLAPQEAEKRANDVFAKAKQSIQEAETKAREAAEKTRKAGAYASLWIFISLLLGAFVASLTATYAGRQRDA